MTLTEARQKLEALGHKIHLQDIGAFGKAPIFYGLCQNPRCGLAAEYNPADARRMGWEDLFGPAVNHECMGKA